MLQTDEIKKFLGNYTDRYALDDDADSGAASKYMNMLQQIVNREEKLLRIELDDLVDHGELNPTLPQKNKGSSLSGVGPPLGWLSQLALVSDCCESKRFQPTFHQDGADDVELLLFLIFLHLFLATLNVFVFQQGGRELSHRVCRNAQRYVKLFEKAADSLLPTLPPTVDIR
jgi:hypothetical protein